MKIIAGLSQEIKNNYDIFSVTSSFHFFTPVSAYTFTAFNLFTTPCIAAIISMWKELKSFKYFLFAIIYQLLIGWGVSASLFFLLKLQFI